MPLKHTWDGRQTPWHQPGTTTKNKSLCFQEICERKLVKLRDVQWKLGIRWHKTKNMNSAKGILIYIQQHILLWLPLFLFDLKNAFSAQFTLFLNIYKSFLKSKVMCNVNQKQCIYSCSNKINTKTKNLEIRGTFP